MLPRLTCFCLTTVALHFVGCTSIVQVSGKPPKKLTPQSSRPLSLDDGFTPIALDTNEVLANTIQNDVSSYATEASYVSIGDYKDLFYDSWCDSEESSYFSDSDYTVQCDDSWCDSEESSYFRDSDYTIECDDSWCDSEESSYYSGSGYTVQCDDSWCDSEESSYFNYGDSYSYL